MIWDKPEILKALRKLHRGGADLSYNALASKNQSLVSAAAYHFGSYRKAVNKATIVFELRQRQRDHEPLNSGAIQREDPGLHAAAVRHFHSYDEALRAANLDPEKVRERRRWDKADVIRGFKSAQKAGRHLSDSAVRREHPAMYGAAVRLFGSFTAARAAAGIKWKR